MPGVKVTYYFLKYPERVLTIYTAEKLQPRSKHTGKEGLPGGNRVEEGVCTSKFTGLQYIPMMEINLSMVLDNLSTTTIFVFYWWDSDPRLQRASSRSWTLFERLTPKGSAPSATRKPVLIQRAEEEAVNRCPTKKRHAGVKFGAINSII